MKSRPGFVVGCVSLLLAGCGSSGSGLSSFAHSYAASYCHFAYHCCTPSDRANPENPFSVTSMTEETYRFSSEQGCADTLGTEIEVALQPYQDSVSAKRMSYDQAAGQSCLSAMTAEAAACDPNAFLATATSQTDGGCNVLAFFEGLAPAGGKCTMDGDCAVGNSVCAPVDGGRAFQGTTPIVTGAATCASPSPVGGACEGNGCAAGSCCSYIGLTCLAYVAKGAACDLGCEATPCDPASDYCDSMGTGVCQSLIASGGICNPYYGGEDCSGFNCVPNESETTGTCKSNNEVIQICVGNPNGF